MIQDKNYFRLCLRYIFDGSCKIVENVERNCFDGDREGKFKLDFIGLIQFFLFNYVVKYNFALYIK